jgi:hypothetical protein
MNRKNRNFIVFSLPVLLALAIFAGLRLRPDRIQSCAEAHRPAATYPDYSATVIPPNLAPLNLRILESGQKFCLRFSAGAGATGEVFSSDGNVQIPPDAWRKLLEANAGSQLRLDIYAKRESGWIHFDTVHNQIAPEEIDPYVVYRYIPPIYNQWDQISIRQRDLRNFDEHTILDTLRSTDPEGKNVGGACINCHTFLNHGTDQMLLHMRPGQSSQIPAMILVRNGLAKKVDTRNGPNPPAAYTSWHPSGKLLAFSRIRVMEMFHSAGVETRLVVDKDSDLGLFAVDTGRVYTVPQISRPERLETFPSWSPDGRYLYFCSAQPPGTDKNDVPLNYDKMQYDLERIAYDPATDRWGQVETVVAAAQIGKSVSLPEISPDGRFLLFCGADFGSFPTYQSSSDLYLLDLSKVESPPVQFLPGSTGSAAAAMKHDPTLLAAGKAATRKLDEINSDRSDSYHSWSSNSRWVVIASKREDGMFARLYIAHLGADGRFSKPFVMPQQDPDFYGRCLMTFNRPELVRQPVTVTATELARAMNSTAGQGAGDASPATGGPAPAIQADRK